MNSIDFGSRDHLEATGRDNADVIDEGDFWYSRVLGQYWVAISKDDHGLSPHIRDGFWEAWIMYWISKNVDSGWKVADLGANVGFYTFQLAALGTMVTAYEPNPVVFDMLEKGARKNVEENPALAINLVNKAVSTKTGKLDFVVPTNHPMNGSLYSSVHSPNGETTISVKSVNKLPAYDFIKIDIEGGEIDVFDLLDPDKHPLVLVEFRWDRYDDPLEFANKIFDKYGRVSFVNNSGSEEPIAQPSDLQQREHADWMLVLRKSE